MELNAARGRPAWVGWAVTLLGSVGVLGLVAAPPFVGDGVRHLIMAGFSNVCHQIPERSPHLGEIQLAVCDRCMGIYLALAAASFLFPVLRGWDAGIQRNAKYLILAAVLVPGVDWIGDVAGFWVNTPTGRMLTGAVFGSITGFFLTGAVVGLLSDRSGDDGHDPQRPTKAAD